MENIIYKNNIEIVISRYNEDLLWLNEYPFNQFEYIVYNRKLTAGEYTQVMNYLKTKYNYASW